MKMKKTDNRHFAFRSALAAFGAALILFSACSNPFSGRTAGERDPERAIATGSIRVSEAGTSERTVMPLTFATIYSYTVTVTPVPTGTVQSRSGVTDLSTVEFTGLEEGGWTVKIVGYDSSLSAVYQGESTVTVSAGATTTASVTLVPTMTGTGDFSVAFSFPESNASACTIGLYTYPGEVAVDAGSYSVVNDSATQKTVSATGLASGTYRLDVRMTIGGTEYVLPDHIVQIYDRCTSVPEGGTAIVCSTATLLKASTVYYVSADGTGTGRTPGSPIGLDAALNAISASSAVSLAYPGTIILTGNVTRETMIPITKPVRITSINTSVPCKLVPSISQADYFLYVEDSAATAADLVLDHVTIDESGMAMGYGILTVENATVTMNEGAVLTGGMAGNGGGAYIQGGGKLVMNTGAAISGNNASANGGGVYVCGKENGAATGGTLEINPGAMIAGNTANTDSGMGGGVYVAANGILTVNGGSISDNNARSARGIALMNPASITINASLAGGIDEVVTQSLANPDKLVYVFQNVSDETAFKAAITACAAKKIPLAMTVESSFSLGTQTVIGNWVELSAPAAVTITKSADVPLLAVGTGGHLSTTGLTFAGMEGQTYTSPIMRVSGGELALGSTTILQYNATSMGGGALYIDSGKVDLTGMTIKYCTASAGGGAIYMGSGTLTIDNADINNCSSGMSGGVLYMGDGSCTVTDGNFRYNSATDSGALAYLGGGTLTLASSAAESEYPYIELYTSGNVGGGAVYQAGGTFNFNGGKIYGNGQTQPAGGGILVGAGTFNLNGGTIVNCSASGSGGAVYLSGSSAVMNMILGNIGKPNDSYSVNSAPNGAGVYVGNGASLIMSGGSIAGNIATGSGGGVCVMNGSSFNLSAGCIGSAVSASPRNLNNQAANGGGVYVDGTSVLSLTGGSILGNDASESGGGIYAMSTINVTPTFLAGSVTNNQAASGGGLWLSHNGAALKKGGVEVSYDELSNIFDSFNLATGAYPQFNAWKVSFDSVGVPYVDPLCVRAGNVISAAPADPVREGYIFAGWYQSTDYVDPPWYFNSNTVNSDMTLYAKWTVIDTIAPVITISTPMAGSYTNLSTFTLAGTAYDEVGVTQVEYSTDNLNWNAAAGLQTWSATCSVSGEGSYTVYARAKDAAGNYSATASVTFTVDTTLPVLAIGIPSPGLYFKQMVNFEGTASDTGSGLATLRYAIDGGAQTAITWVGDNWSCVVDTTGLTEGTHTFQLTATDVAGNQYTGATLPFIVDNTAPALTLTSGSTYTVATGGTVSLSGTVNDAGSIVSMTCTIGEVSTPLSYSGSIWSINANVPATTGFYALTVTATDAAGNTTQVGADVTVN